MAASPDTLDVEKLLAGEVSFTKDGEEALGQPNCPLGSSVAMLFMRARDYRANSGADQRMRRAFFSSQSKYLPEDCGRIGAIDIFMGIFAPLRAIFLSWHFDRVAPAGERQFTVSPTPVPEVPQELRDMAIQKVIDDLINSGIPPEKAQEFLKVNIAELKANVLSYLYQKAKAAAEKMTSAMLTTMIEGSYLEEYFSWWANFATYPLSIMQFPLVEEKKKIDWVKGKIKVVEEATMTFKAISPMDFWITQDGSNTDNARAVFVRARISHEALVDLADDAPENGPIHTNIMTIIERGEEPYAMWMATGAGSDNEKRLLEGTPYFMTDRVTGTYDVLKCWIKLRGDKLKQYGVKSISNPVTVELKDLSLYDTEVWLLGGTIIMIKPNSHPLGKRPFFLASWEKINGTIYGRGLYDVVSDAERTACKTARDMIKNAEFSSGIIAEVDGSRFAEGSIPVTLEPWRLYRTEVPLIGGSPNAIQLQQIPSKSAEMMALYNFYAEKAQKDCGINYLMAGVAEGASWMRTNVAVDTVQGNSTKLINYRAMLADQGCFLPMFRDLWLFQMLFNPDKSIKVDADVDLKGLISVATKDAQKAHLAQLLQYLPAVIGAMKETGQSLDGRFITDLVRSIFADGGADVRYLSDPADQTAIASAVGANQNTQSIAQPDGRSAVPPGPDDQARLPAPTGG